VQGRLARALVVWGVVCPIATAQFIPGDIGSVGLTRIVDDTTAGDVGGHYGYNPLGSGNWEPYVSVLGNRVFLFESTTYAESGPGLPDLTHMRYALAFQPAEGGPARPGEVFFGDDGNPYRGQINASRQDGNPGRVAGDKRPGARHFIAGGEASPHTFPGVFGVMPPGPSYTSASRYGTVQIFSLDPASLMQVMSSQAMDVLAGRTGSPADPTEVSRFGGELAALSDGNFLAVVDDKSNLVVPYRTPTATILRPDGTVVRGPFSIGPPYACTVWSNVAACRGGFVIRCGGCGGTLRFFDNAGNFLGEASQADPNLRDSQGNPVVFQTHRGDYTRIAGHIHSPYVYVAGYTTGNPLFTDKDIVSVAVWDARTRTFVAQANVTELTPEHGGVGADTEDFAPNANTDTPRVNLAVDALNRVCVVFTRGTVDYMQNQIAARVLAFDPHTGTFAHLTHSFWAFRNYCDDMFSGCAGIRGVAPSVAMTTRAICIAAKGEINLSNQPELGPDSAYAVNYYTVISHPVPQDDPTCAVSPGDADADGDVDVNDFAVFQTCFNGPGQPWSGGAEPAKCACMDRDADGDVDVNDFAVFQGCFNGPNRPAACG